LIRLPSVLCSAVQVMVARLNTCTPALLYRSATSCPRLSNRVTEVAGIAPPTQPPRELASNTFTIAPVTESFVKKSPW
jgi:hypothetical protein